MSSSPHIYPPGHTQAYRSAYSGGMVSDEKGMFHHFVRQPGPIHELNGYWRFNTFKDDRCAYHRGFATPEEILVAQDRGDASFDEILLTWLPGKNDPTNRKAITGTPAAHLETIYAERHVLGKSLSLRGCIPFYPLSNDKNLQIYRAQRYFGQDGMQHRLATPPQAAQLSSLSDPTNGPLINPAYDSDSQDRQSGSLLRRTCAPTRIASQKQDELSTSESRQQGSTPKFPTTFSQNSDSTRTSVKKTPLAKALSTLTQRTGLIQKTTESLTDMKLPSNQNLESTQASTSQYPLQRPALPPMQGLRGFNRDTRSLSSFPPSNQHVSYYGNPFDHSQYQRRSPPSTSIISKYADGSAPPMASPLHTALQQTSVASYPDSLRTTRSHSRASDASSPMGELQLPMSPTLLQTDFGRQTSSPKTQLPEDVRHTETEVPTSNKRAPVESIDLTVDDEGSCVFFGAQKLRQSQTLDRQDKAALVVEKSDATGPLSVRTNQNLDTIRQNTIQYIGKSGSNSPGRENSILSTHGNDVGLYGNPYSAYSERGAPKSEVLNNPSKTFLTRKNSIADIFQPTDGSQQIFTPPLTPNISQAQLKGAHSPNEEDPATFYYVGELDSDEPVPEPADPFATLPCMDCEQVGEHRWDCHIGHVGPITTVTVLDYRNFAEDAQRFDPGPFIGENWHVGPPEDPEPEDSSTQIKGMADVIRNEVSFKSDLELQMLPDQLMVLLWAMKTSFGIEVIER